MAQFLMATAVVTVTLQVAISEPTGSDWSTGWCSNWKQLPDRNRDGYVAEYGRTFFNNPVDEEDCAAKCRAHPNCKQAVYESEGPWGKECWLGGQVSEKKETGSRKNTQDYCYHPCKTRFTQEEDDTAFAAKMEELCPASESESGSADLTGNAKLCGGQKMQSNHFLSLRSSLANGLFTSSSLSTRCKAHCVGDIRDPKRYFVWGGNCWKRKKFSSSRSAKCKKNSEEFDELIKWERERISRCEA